MANEANKVATGSKVAAKEAPKNVDNGAAKAPQNKVVINMDKNLQSMNGVVEFSKGNLEAVVVSAKAVAEGAELITRQFVETSKKQFEDAQSAVQGILSAKSPNEAFQLQNEFAKAQFDSTVASISKFSETFLKVVNDISQPLSTRVGLAADSVKKAVAA